MDTMLARVYGLLKIYKINVSVRPIVSLVKGPPYKLATNLYDNLKNATPLPRSNTKNIVLFLFHN